jgi:hypothetical protein
MDNFHGRYHIPLQKHWLKKDKARYTLSRQNYAHFLCTRKHNQNWCSAQMLPAQQLRMVMTVLVYAKTNEPGGRWGNAVQTVAWWRRPVASNVAQDIFHWAMCLVLQHLIAMASKTASERGAFDCHRRAWVHQIHAPGGGNGFTMVILVFVGWKVLFLRSKPE